MVKEQISEYQLRILLEQHENYTFPEFICMWRRIRGDKRRAIWCATGITQTRLFYLENGRFKKMPTNLELKNLSAFYSIPPLLLSRKARKFIKSGQAKRQGDSS